MKRSEINKALKEMENMIRDYRFSREFDSCILEKVVAGIDLPAFFVSNFMFYLVVISGNSIENMIY